jgi:hypothetical protein
MKRHHCLIGLLPVTFALLCSSGPARAGDQVPFQGTFTGFAYPGKEGCPNAVPISGAGQATQLGRFTWASTIMVTGCDLFPSFIAHDVSETLTAANGDQLFGTGVGTGMLVDFTDPSKIRILVDVTITITGGTGRFVNSTGALEEHFLSKVYERTFLPDGSPADPIVATLEGTLSAVGADRK